MREKILGVNVDFVSRQEAVKKISSWVEYSEKQPLKQVVTAYSEFLVRANYDKRFKEIINKADLVTPDGISVLAAGHYLKESKNRNLIFKLLIGFGTGLDILSGSLGDTVTGVWLFEKLSELAGANGWKVFLLGSWGDTAERTATMLLKRFPGIIVDSDPGEKKVGSNEDRNKEVIKKINEFQPDILCVTYSPVVQEKWIEENRDKLKAKVAIGLGGTFNEFLGEFKKAPSWMEKMGLKWLWRLIQEPKRWRRILNAVVVFPWLVFLESFKQE